VVGYLVITLLYRFIVEFANETIFKICEHLAKLQAIRLFHMLNAPGHLLHKDENSPSFPT